MQSLIEQVGLTWAKRRQLKEYSKGMTRRIGLAQALINDPELILLDEPTSGLDPLGTREMKDMILKLRDQGKTIVMCSHLLADVQDVCDRIAILYQGDLKELGRVDSLLKVSDETQVAGEESVSRSDQGNSGSDCQARWRIDFRRESTHHAGRSVLEYRSRKPGATRPPFLWVGKPDQS